MIEPHFDGWTFPAGRLSAAFACTFGAIAVTLSLVGSVGAAGSGRLAQPQGEVLLRISGNIVHTNVAGEAHFDRTMIEELSAHTLATTTSVTDGVNVFEGVLMRDLLDSAGAHGEMVTATALNDYAIDIPMSDFTDFDVVAALSMDGERLLARDKGPIWIVYPRDDFPELQDIRYDYRWVWQLTHIEVR